MVVFLMRLKVGTELSVIERKRDHAGRQQRVSGMAVGRR
jgi:hypothetical protein